MQSGERHLLIHSSLLFILYILLYICLSQLIHSLIHLFHSTSFIYHQFCAWQGFCTPKGKQSLIRLGFFPVDCLYSEIQVSVDKFQGPQIPWNNRHKWVSLFSRHSICHFYQPLESTPRSPQYREMGGLWFLFIAFETLPILSWLDLELGYNWVNSRCFPWVICALTCTSNYTCLKIRTSQACLNNANQKNISQYLTLYRYSKLELLPTSLAASETSRMPSSSKKLNHSFLVYYLWSESCAFKD